MKKEFKIGYLGFLLLLLTYSGCREKTSNGGEPRVEKQPGSEEPNEFEISQPSMPFPEKGPVSIVVVLFLSERYSEPNLNLLGSLYKAELTRRLEDAGITVTNSGEAKMSLSMGFSENELGNDEFTLLTADISVASNPRYFKDLGNEWMPSIVQKYPLLSEEGLLDKWSIAFDYLVGKFIDEFQKK